MPAIRTKLARGLISRPVIQPANLVQYEPVRRPRSFIPLKITLFYLQKTTQRRGADIKRNGGENTAILTNHCFDITFLLNPLFDNVNTIVDVTIREKQC
jgi:hypothetical protein